MILSTSKQNDIVLDPFFGTGTTGAVAKKLKRNFIGIEKDIGYVLLAKRRIDEVGAFIPESEWIEEEKEKHIRVAFETLLKEDLVKAGESLHTHKTYGSTAFVLSDGNLEYRDGKGSIHSVGAMIQQTTSCNGWKFWYVMRGGEAVLLDDLRKEYLRMKQGL